MAENVKIVIKAFDQTKKGFGTVGKGLLGITKSIVSMRSAMVLAAGAAGFGYLVKSSLNATDALKKTADKIGTTTEALASLRYAADLTGVSTNTMDMALQRFTRRTAEAANGTGEAKNALKTLGLNAKELINMPLDERMLALADAFSKEESEAQKLALAFKLFDSEGAALVVTLGKGRDGLKEMFGEAKALGLTMSSGAASGVEDANDAISKLIYLGKGLKDQFSAALAPAITTVTKQITDFFLEISKNENGVELWAKGMALSVLEATKSIINGINQAYSALTEMESRAASALDSFKIKNKENAIKGLERDAKRLNKQITDLDNKDFSLSQVIGDILTFDSVGKKMERLSALQLRIKNEIKELGEMGQRGVVDGKKLINLDGINESIENLKANIAEGGSDGGSVFKEIAKDVGNVEQAFGDWQTTVPTTDEMVQSFTKNGLDGMTDALTAGITGAAKFSDAMKSMAKSVVDSLIKMLVQKYIVDAAFGVITGAISGGGGNTATIQSGTLNMSSGMSSAVPNQLTGQAFPNTSFAGGGYTGNGGRSGGVDGKGGFPAILHPRETVIDHNQGQSSGGGGVTVNQTINISTGVQQTVRAEIATLMPQIANASKQAVADARQRGGGFSKALVGA